MAAYGSKKERKKKKRKEQHLKGFSTHTGGVGHKKLILLFVYFLARLGPAKIPENCPEIEKQ